MFEDTHSKLATCAFRLMSSSVATGFLSARWSAAVPSPCRVMPVLPPWMRNGRFRFRRRSFPASARTLGSGRSAGHRRLRHGCGLRQQAGIAAAGVAALNAGVDLILVSYDPVQYFTMMNALITADRAGGLEAAARARSARRLAGTAR